MAISIPKIAALSSDVSRPAGATRPERVAIRAKQVPFAVRWCFLAFVFTFPFEATAIGSHSVSKLIGLAFFALYLAHYNPLSQNRSLASVPNVMWWFIGYAAVYLTSGVRVDPELFGEFVMRLLTLLQLLGLFWIASDLLRDARMARSVLLTYLLSAAVLGAGIVLRVPGFAEQVVEGRVTAAGQNLNAVALHMAIGVLIAIGLIVSKVYTRRTMNLVLAALTVPILLAMISTGSRGGIAAFVIGICVYVLPYWKKKRPLAAASIAAAGVIAVAILVLTTPELLQRWQESYYEGELSDREKIFADTIDMISERPLLGWGPVEYGYELGFRGRSSDPNDTHNLIFHLLAEVGIVGTIPFVIGLFVLFRAAWRARSGVLGLLPLALMGAILAGNLSGNYLVWKPQWFALALVTATGLASTVKLWIGPAPRIAAYPPARTRRLYTAK